MDGWLTHGVVMLILDARREGVSVPPGFAPKGLLNLNFSERFDPSDLVVDDWGAKQTLSFSGKNYPVRIPWSAVYGMVSLPRDGTTAPPTSTWPHDVPDDFNAWMLAERGDQKAAPDETYRDPGKRGHLRVVK